MARLTPQQAGRLGGRIGGKSRSTAKLAAARRNGFQKQEPKSDPTSSDSAPTPVLIAQAEEQQ